MDANHGQFHEFIEQVRVAIVSVVRDFEMYEKCIRGNPHCAGGEFFPIDNRERHEGVGVGYNRFLDSRPRDEDVWYVFCHEDFRPLEHLESVLSNLDKGSVYGPIGGVLTKRRHWLFGEIWSGSFRGSVMESDKVGNGVREIGQTMATGTVVDSVDCQCLIVHASLVAGRGLRFDENLSFDLYAEDFCLTAFLRHGVLTRIVKMKAQHYSRGSVLSRFYSQLSYLDRKYPKYEAFGSVGFMIGGGRTFVRRMQKKARAFLDSACPGLTRILLKISA